MAEVIRYVDPDATGSGDGTSWADAYTSLSAWESGERTNLVTAGDWHHVYVRASSGTADTDAVDVAGWTTDADHYILIEAASTDRAQKDATDITKYRLAEFTTHNHYVQLDGVQLVNNDDTIFIYGEHVIISNCRINCTGGNAGINGGSDGSADIYNTIIYGGTYDGIRIDGGTYNIYNCIVYGPSSDGIEYNSANGTVENCVVSGGSTDFDIDSGSTVTVDHCATNSGEGSGTNQITPSGDDWNNEFNDPDNGDFTLLNTGNCYHGGSSGPDTSLYTTDIEGDTYNSSAYSIGVDEYTAGGSNYTVTADGGTFLRSGAGAEVIVAYLVGIGSGSLVRSGEACSVVLSFIIGSEGGSLIITGEAAGLVLNNLLVAEAGSFIRTGADANITYSDEGHHIIVAEGGSFLITMSNISKSRWDLTYPWNTTNPWNNLATVFLDESADILDLTFIEVTEKPSWYWNDL